MRNFARASEGKRTEEKRRGAWGREGELPFQTITTCIINQRMFKRCQVIVTFSENVEIISTESKEGQLEKKKKYIQLLSAPQLP